MRSFLILALTLTAVSGKPNGLSEIRVDYLKSAKSLAPSVAIHFANGQTDRLVLQPFYASEEQERSRKVSCNFIGHLENEETACVAMTGCLEKDNLEFTINSKKLEHNKYILHKDGTLEAVESAFKDAKDKVMVPSQSRQFDGQPTMMPLEQSRQLDGTPTMMPSQERFAGRALPSTNLLKIKIGYDDSFLADFGNSVSATETYLDAMVAHVQAHFCLDSLGTKVKVQRSGDLTHHSGYTWKATGSDLEGSIRTIAANSNADANLWVFMCKDPEFYGTIGIAWLGTVCVSYWPGYQTSINEKRESTLATSEVVTHEMGHNLGMRHDFDLSSSCTGFMDYGNAPNEWSSCSRSEFLNHYNAIQASSSLSWCMPPAADACGGTGTTPTPPPPTPSSCEGLNTHPSWWQDKYCDDFLNTPECGYDGGDCCFKFRTGWNYYCTECACKGADCPQLNAGWFRDRFCDDFMNTAGCFYDGGDCCAPHSTSYWDYFCNDCLCLDPLA